MSASINLDLLGKFCSDHRPEVSAPFNSYNYRGRAAVNFDVCATNGQVFLCIPNAKHNDLKEQQSGIPAQWWWALQTIEGREDHVKPATKAAIARIPEYVQAQLELIPAVELLSVPKVRVTVCGRTTRQRWEKIDQNGVVFFRWADGVGLCVAEKLNTERSNRED